MPIECHAFSGHELLEPQGRIEPGTAHTFLYFSGEVGRAVLAACHNQDKGGRVYDIETSVLEEISDGDGSYDGSLLDGQQFEPIPMGGTILVPIPAGTNGETNLVFTHIPLN